MTEHICPLCNAPMNASTQPALVPGRPDTVLLRCTRYTCDFTTDARDLHAIVGTSDSYARTHAHIAGYAELQAEMVATA